MLLRSHRPEGQRRRALAALIRPGRRLRASAAGLLLAIGSAGVPSAGATSSGLLARPQPDTLVAGCTPQLQADFIDQVSWDGRRLLPRDCRLLEDGAPLFAWTEPDDRDRSVGWTLNIQDTKNAVVAKRQSAAPRLWLDQPLPAGSYAWTVTYTTRGGERRVSAPRRFGISANARATVLPTAASLVQRVEAKARPRLAPAGTGWDQVAARARDGDYRDAYEALLKAADEAVGAPLPADPDLPSRSLGGAAQTAFVDAQMGLYRASGKEGVRVEALAFAWHFTGEARYRDAGLARLRNLARWSPSGATSEARQDQANRNVYGTLARGADLFWSALNDADRALIGRTLRERLLPVVSTFAKLDQAPYDSHLQTAVGFATVALALADGLPEFPEASAWLARAWDLYAGFAYVWGEEDGGMGNGTAYGWYDFINLVNRMAELRLIADVDIASREFARHLGDSLMAFTPTPRRILGVFGDETETDYLFEAYAGDAFRLYALLTREPRHEWYWRQGPRKPGYLSPVHFALLALLGAPPSPAAPQRRDWVFEDVGQAALHNDASAPVRSSLYFKSSRLGAYNHSHADQNSFVLHVNGVPLLVGGGYYPYYGSPHHLTVARATRYQNALTFDGGIGQAEPSARPVRPGPPLMSMDARGSITGTVGSERISIVTGDATLAYRGRDPGSRSWQPLLEAAVRSVAYARAEHVVIVYDWARSDAPRRWELNYHAPARFAPQGDDGARITFQGASACISHHGLAGSFTQRDDFDVPPERPRPPQFHGRYTASAPSRELAVVTVIREQCNGVPVDVKFADGEALVSIGADRLRFRQREAELLRE